jgi:hypothetical protein
MLLYSYTRKVQEQNMELQGLKKGRIFTRSRKMVSKNASVEKLCGGQLRLQGGAEFLKYTCIKTANGAHA